MDAVTSHSGDLLLRRAERAGEASRPVTSESTHGLSHGTLDSLWRLADGRSCSLPREAFSKVLSSVGDKLNYGLPPGTFADAAQRTDFFGTLRLGELALAHACALGVEAAWQRFRILYRASLIQVAMGVAGSPALIDIDNDADGFFASLRGPCEPDGGYRQSPLASYTGRSSLLGWLRAFFAQWHTGRNRRFGAVQRAGDAAATTSAVLAAPDHLALLASAVARALQALRPGDGFLLSAYFLDLQKLSRIGQTLGISEITVRRRLKRLLADLRARLLCELQTGGMSKRAAGETLAIDPRSLQIGDSLRVLLQRSQLRTFSDQNLIVLKPERLAGPATSNRS